MNYTSVKSVITFLAVMGIVAWKNNITDAYKYFLIFSLLCHSANLPFLYTINV